METDVIERNDIMSSLQEYINENYPTNSNNWFETEVDKPHNMTASSKIVNEKSYLKGQHKIKRKSDITFKGETYPTSKRAYNIANSLNSFYVGYISGKECSLIGENEDVLHEYERIYKRSNYYSINHDITKDLVTHGMAVEYVYYDAKTKLPKSKLLEPENCYPLYSKFGEYIGLISFSRLQIEDKEVSYYYIYEEDKVTTYSDASGHMKKIDERKSFGLPIVYRNSDGVYGENVGLCDCVYELLDEYEDFMNKLSDSVYTNSLNPILAVSGQTLNMPKGSLSAEAVGWAITLDNGGEIKYVSSLMDNNTIKTYIENLEKQIYSIVVVPSVLVNGNISNVSENSIKMLYSKADGKANAYRYILVNGFNTRNDIIARMLGYNDGEVETVVNFSMPSADSDTINNLHTLYEDGVIDKVTYLEMCPLGFNTAQVLKRLEDEEEERSEVEVEEEVYVEDVKNV